MTRLMGLQAREMPLCSLQLDQLQVRLIYISSTKQHRSTSYNKGLSVVFSITFQGNHLAINHHSINPSTHQPICLGQLLHLLRRFRKGPKIHRRLMSRGAQLGGGRTHLGHLAGQNTGKDVLHDMFGGKVSRATKKIYEIGMNEIYSISLKKNSGTSGVYNRVYQVRIHPESCVFA